ncbi:DNA adenine methylase [Selenomonas sp. F0473]|uniref:DNA adenine methylase n=1 Tax=Selenomonas sp. F0473 TaxID=999423 RepID=UPI0025D62AFC|nr:DNA adenine methylase [Selenomonas sp. F0473]
MSHTKSPLRYPGGKSQLSTFIQHILELNRIPSPIYCEPFSGGAGVPIALLLNGQVDSVILNDFDIAIYSIWYAILNDTDSFLRRIDSTPANIDTWHKQHDIYEQLNDSTEYDPDLAFATFFLNRTNISGIITGGPIGGLDQKGQYKLDCRYNKSTLRKKILDIAVLRNRIRLYHMDASELIQNILMYEDPTRLFVFFDPPYYQQGKNLYKNAFTDEEHVHLSNIIREMNCFKWIVTYDNHPRIQEIYQDMAPMYYSLQYMANKKRKEKEIFLHSPETLIEDHGNVIFEAGIPVAV